MQYRVYDRRKLAYIDGGYVVDYNIDDDYIVNNNSSISIVKETNAVEGDIIVLIKNSGPFHKGVITSVDNADLTISYKSDKQLFNDNMPNIKSADFAADSDLTVAGKLGLKEVAEILKIVFSQKDPAEQDDNYDEYKALPLDIITNGDVYDDAGEHKILWTWSDNSINVVDWLVELFEKYAVVLSWTIDFDINTERLAERTPKYIVTISSITDSGGIIKDNVDMQTITYTKEKTPESTVCMVIDSETKEFLDQYYLYISNGKYFISKDKNLPYSEAVPQMRVLPVKTAIVEFNGESGDDTDGDEEITTADAAYDELIPSQFNQAIEVELNTDSKMFDFENTQFGEQYKIVNQYGTIDSIYTGKKMKTGDKFATLYFGLGRQNYTDIIQIQFRKQRYSTLYNQKKKGKKRYG